MSVRRYQPKPLLLLSMMLAGQGCVLGTAEPVFDRDGDAIVDGMDCDPGDAGVGAGTLVYLDSDSDGYGDPDEWQLKCSDAIPSYVSDASDCDDSVSAISPAETEVCDDVDNDCSGIVDDVDESEGDLYYIDGDGDGYGDSSVVACEAPTSGVELGGDCDDSDLEIFPGATEVCDEIDNDCDDEIDDGVIESWYPDADEDGYGDSSDPSAAIEGCEGPEGYTNAGGDCNDQESNLNPGVNEYCDEVDNNCNGVVDDVDEFGGYGYYEDRDGDGEGGEYLYACEIPEDAAYSGDDCNDDDPSVYLYAYDTVGDGVDSNCFGEFYDDWIYPLAGSGEQGTSDGGGDALEAQLDTPISMAVDADLNVYVSDLGDHRIRCIDLYGFITTVAGTGTDGNSGDGGAATEAQLGEIAGLAVDGTLLYLADRSNHRVRAVELSGYRRIGAIAGTGTAGFGGDGEAATAAMLNAPRGLFVDRLHQLYIADAGNHRIRRLDGLGQIHTVAGNGSGNAAGTEEGIAALDANLLDPWGVSGDADGNFWVADTGNHRVRRIDLEGKIWTVAGSVAGYSGDGAAATAATLNTPASVVVAPDGDLYVADRVNNTIRWVEASSGLIKSVVGPSNSDDLGDYGAASKASLSLPSSVALDEWGDLYIADTGHHVLRFVGP